MPVPTLSNPDIRDVSDFLDFAGHLDASQLSSSPTLQASFADSSELKYFVLVPELTPELEAVVKKVAAAEPPPQAKSRKEVKENCQYWAIRVMKKLVELGMMDPQKVVDCQKLLEPVRK